MSAATAPYKKGTLLIISGPCEHLHIVLTDPVHYPPLGYEVVLVVNVTSIKGIYDDACVLEAGCHRFIKRPSYIAYRYASLSSTTRIATEVAGGDIRSHDPVDDELFNKVIEGFRISKHAKPKLQRFLEKYSV